MRSACSNHLSDGFSRLLLRLQPWTARSIDSTGRLRFRKSPTIHKIRSDHSRANTAMLPRQPSARIGACGTDFERCLCSLRLPHPLSRGVGSSVQQSLRRTWHGKSRLTNGMKLVSQDSLQSFRRNSGCQSTIRSDRKNMSVPSRPILKNPPRICPTNRLESQTRSQPNR